MTETKNDVDAGIESAKSAWEQAKNLVDALSRTAEDWPLSSSASALDDITDAVAGISAPSIGSVNTAVAKLRHALDSGDRVETQKAATALADSVHAVIGKLTGAHHQITAGLREPVNVYYHTFKTALKTTPEFKKKGLCTYQAPIEVTCGHQCLYCSTPSLFRHHPALKAIHHTAYQRGFTMIDPDTPARIAEKIPKALTAEDVVMVSTTADAWSPEAQELDLGRGILQVLLEKTPAQVRILTKNAAVEKDYDLCLKYRDRIIVGLSTGIPRSQTPFAEILEPNSSLPADRFEALRKAHDIGLRTYGMLCPCPPRISDQRRELEELFDEVLRCGAEDIWLEPINSRGKAIPNCVEALQKAGADAESQAMESVRGARGWSAYATELIETAIAVATDRGVLEKLHVLLYPQRLQPRDRNRLEKHRHGIIWLE